MSKPHKHRDAINAWANGLTIQSKHETDDRWYDVDSPGATPNFHLNGYSWRVKPKMVTKTYQMAVVKSGGHMHVIATNTVRGCDIPGFVNWVGDQVTVEFEEEPAL